MTRARGTTPPRLSYDERQVSEPQRQCDICGKQYFPTRPRVLPTCTACLRWGERVLRQLGGWQ